MYRSPPRLCDCHSFRLERNRDPVPSTMGRKRRGKRACLMTCHHRPYSIRQMRPNRSRHHSPLTGFVPASEVTIHERRNSRFGGRGLCGHGDQGRRHPRPMRPEHFLRAGPGGGRTSGARPAARGVRTRAAPWPSQLRRRSFLALFWSPTSKWGSNTIAWAGGWRDRDGGAAPLPTSS